MQYTLTFENRYGVISTEINTRPKKTERGTERVIPAAVGPDHKPLLIYLGLGDHVDAPWHYVTAENEWCVYITTLILQPLLNYSLHARLVPTPSKYPGSVLQNHRPWAYFHTQAPSTWVWEMLGYRRVSETLQRAAVTHELNTDIKGLKGTGLNENELHFAQWHEWRKDRVHNVCLTCFQVEREAGFHEIGGVALCSQSPHQPAVCAAYRSGRHQFEQCPVMTGRLEGLLTQKPRPPPPPLSDRLTDWLEPGGGREERELTRERNKVGERARAAGREWRAEPPPAQPGAVRWRRWRRGEPTRWRWLGG